MVAPSFLHARSIRSATARYSKTDIVGQAAILSVALHEILWGQTIPSSHSTAVRDAFGMTRVIEKSEWGETLYKYVSTVWHVDIGARLDRLAELNQIYLIP